MFVMEKVSASAYTRSNSIALDAANLNDKKGSKRNGSLFVGKFRLFNHYVHGQFLLLAATEFVALSALMSFLSGWQVEGLGDAIRMLFPPLMLAFFLSSVGLYDTRQRADSAYVLKRIFAALILSTISLYLINVVTVWIRGYPLFTLGITAAAASAIVILLIRAAFYRWVDGILLKRRILVYGTGHRASHINRLRRKADRRGFELVGFVEASSHETGEALVDGAKVVTHQACLSEWAVEHNIDEIIIAMDDRRQSLHVDQLLRCRMSGIAINDMLDFFERERGVIELDLFNPGWMIYSRGFNPDAWRAIKKRFIDLLASVFLITLFSPFILVTALAIWIESKGKGPIFYKQQRVGKNGLPFDVYKFRSMRTDAESSGKVQWAQKNDPRVTRVGNIIRKFRIDELPQLWNVLIGDMSLVGPRPERPQFVDHLNDLNALYGERHRVSPGVTGWAQLCYPYGASDEDSLQKLQYDLYYVKNHSFFLDMYILIQTVEVVLFQKGSR